MSECLIISIYRTLEGIRHLVSLLTSEVSLLTSEVKTALFSLSTSEVKSQASGPTGDGSASCITSVKGISRPTPLQPGIRHSGSEAMGSWLKMLKNKKIKNY